MAGDDAQRRATRVLKGTSYLALATQDADGPWAAALAYTLVLPDRMYFVSQTASRHGRALAVERPVAGVIFDSQASQDDVESIQFSGRGHAVTDAARIHDLMRAGNNGEEPDESEVSRLATDPSVALYELVIEDAYVLDQAAWAEKGIDAREPVAFAQAAQALTAS